MMINKLNFELTKEVVLRLNILNKLGLKNDYPFTELLDCIIAEKSISFYLDEVLDDEEKEGVDVNVL